ncbi:MAG TPA: hypothetical protein VIL48_12440 [Acidimicrobiales bacterium]
MSTTRRRPAPPEPEPGPPADPALPPTTSRRGLIAGLALGLPLLAYGVRGALVDAADTHPPELAAWIAGTALAGDLLVVPLALGAARLARRMAPARAWPAVRAGLLVTAVLTLVAWPFVRGYGRDPAVPSLLNRDYGAGLAAAVAAVWAAVLATAVLAALVAAAAPTVARRGRALRGRQPPAAHGPGRPRERR